MASEQDVWKKMRPACCLRNPWKRRLCDERDYKGKCCFLKCPLLTRKLKDMRL